MRTLSIAFNGNTLLSGLIISNISALIVLIMLYKLIVAEGHSVANARRSLLYLAFFPTAFILLMPYTEAFFLLFVLLTFLFLKKENWLLSGITGLVATLSRFMGVVFVLVIAIELFRQNNWDFNAIKLRILYAFIPLLGIGIYFAWLLINGLPNVQMAQFTWYRVSSLPGVGLINSIKRIFMGNLVFIEVVDLLAILLFVVLGVLCISHLPIRYSVYLWLGLIFNLSQYQLFMPLMGQARFCMVLFPAFIVLGDLGQNNIINRIVVYTFFGFWLFYAGLYILWGFTG